MPYRQEHAMIGPGGKVRVPFSESTELQKAWEILENLRWNKIPNSEVAGIQRAMAILSRLRTQVSEGFHRNPYTPFRVIGPIAEDVYDIRYRHSKNGKDYEHEFNGAVNILAIERHGKKDMLITSSRGLSLWDEFPDER